MSWDADNVDDLHHAEDLVGLAAVALDGLIGGVAEVVAALAVLDERGAGAEAAFALVAVVRERLGNGGAAEARLALAQLRDYCRPTCGWRDDGECADDEDTCGCLCDHGGG